MKLAHQSTEIAKGRLELLLLRLKVKERDAVELTKAFMDLASSLDLERQRAMEDERDETRRRFYEVHPTLHPERGSVVIKGPS